MFVGSYGYGLEAVPGRRIGLRALAPCPRRSESGRQAAGQRASALEHRLTSGSILPSTEYRARRRRHMLQADGVCSVLWPADNAPEHHRAFRLASTCLDSQSGGGGWAVLLWPAGSAAQHCHGVETPACEID